VGPVVHGRDLGLDGVDVLLEFGLVAASDNEFCKRLGGLGYSIQYIISKCGTSEAHVILKEMV
jgi:hypothetical protein